MEKRGRRRSNRNIVIFVSILTIKTSQLKVKVDLTSSDEKSVPTLNSESSWSGSVLQQRTTSELWTAMILADRKEYHLSSNIINLCEEQSVELDSVFSSQC